MSEPENHPQGIDFAGGVGLAEVPGEGIVPGHVGGEPALLVRHRGECFVTGAVCTHYGGPLSEGLVVDGAIRCPWHHAAFSLHNGEAVRPPALASIPCWRAERSGDRIFAREQVASGRPSGRPGGPDPGPVVIIGGGAAAQVAAETLRREGFGGQLTLVSADPSPPCDRPNLSKDYLAGTAPAEWIPLRPPGFYSDNAIELRLGVQVTAIDPGRQEVRCADGSRLTFGALLLATGAQPVRLPLPGADKPHVFYLRSLADSSAIVAAAAAARRAVVVGASFIGLEAAAALKKRGLEVHVVAPETNPMEARFGVELGTFIRRLHEANGIAFHLGTTVTAIGDRRVTLGTEEKIDADLVVLGVGVRPSLELAQGAGLAIDHGVVVNEYLATSHPRIFAAGDIARWPDRLTGGSIRVEHWVVAERQGQTAARNMLGAGERFDAVPFFWSQHYDTVISYVGHAEKWDRLAVHGDLAAGNCAVDYFLGRRKLAVATIGRDGDSLRAEREFEQAIAAGV